PSPCRFPKPDWLGRVLLSLPLIILVAGLIPLATDNARATIAPAVPRPSPKSTTRLSQIPISARSLQQGNQILLNGRPLSAAWSQWQTKEGSIRTGISDAGVIQTIGGELLNTEDLTSQPLQWFSDPSTHALNLLTRFTGSLRYLDVTDFARQSGWQLQVTGNALQISAPVAKVLAIRQAKQPWGDRLVIELDHPATWQVDQANQEFTLALDAQTDSPLLEAFKPGLSDRINSLQLESAGNQTRLRVGTSTNLQPRIWSLPNPNRLIVDIRPDSLVNRNILWAPGLRWRGQIINLGSDRFPVVWLEVNLRQPGTSLKPILVNPNSVPGTAPLAQTARFSQAAAAINGGFFNRNNQLPLGTIRQNGHWLSGPILNRGAIAWNNSGEVKIDRLTLQETLITPSGLRLPLTHLNSGYIQAGIARYTPAWGPTYTPLSNQEILVTVQNNRVTSQQVNANAGSTSVPIPGDGYLLVLRSNQSVATTLATGTLLRLESITNPVEFDRYPQILAAGPLLLQNRQIVLNPEAEKFSRAFAIEQASRSAIGQMPDGTLLLVAVHHRLEGEGASLTETAQLMQQLGAVNALNLDGGSSTTLYLGGQILDRPPRTTARVHNGIGIFVQPGL
ncbi:MAG: phosphodiester glycosidase family protein, partial [Kovacikia sp.]